MKRNLRKQSAFKVILLITINSIMGTGIWFLTSAGAKHAGPASLVSWGVLSLISVYIAMCFGELVSMFPKAGGVYEFSKHAYNRFTSFLMGWLAWLVGNLTTALLIVAAMDYLIPDPSRFVLKMVISAILIIILNVIAIYGIEASGLLL